MESKKLNLNSVQSAIAFSTKKMLEIPYLERF